MEIKGRGAQLNPHNKFLAREIVLDADGDGLDEAPSILGATQYLEVQAKSIINPVPSPDVGMAWSVNPYQGCEHGCVYCYARNTHEYWGFSAGVDFESKIQVKVNAPALLEKELSKPGWKGEPISISGNTDCYQPAERKYRLTRRMLQICLQMGQPVGLISKNVAMLQDLDVLEALAADNLIRVYFSISTLDEELRRVMEPRTATAAGKLKAIQTLTSKGIPCGVMSAPIIPGLNDHEIPAIVKAAAEAGALQVGYNFVRLNGAIGQIFTNWINQALPDRAPKVLRQIASGHAGKLNDSQFGRRMKGEGPFAETVALLHEKARQAYLSNAVMPDFNRTLFRRGGQLNLFG
jgi:DNA repair photolyase